MGTLWKGLAGGAMAAALGAAGLAMSAGATSLSAAGTTHSRTNAHRALVVHPLITRMTRIDGTGPPTEATCLAVEGIRCYGPAQIETAYDEQPLFRQGITGRGETIVLVDSFGAPDIRQDLARFDRSFRLQTPPSFSILKYGNVPAYTPSTATMSSWAGETTLDVEYSHTTAPGANILLVETATAETVGVTGFPTIVNAENYVINHHLGDVISQSFGASEQTFKSPATIVGLRSAYENAARNNVTVLAAAGDTGAAGAMTNTKGHYFSYPVVGWPASDPLVTGVGGTELTLSQSGARLAPDQVWNDTTLFGSPAAGSGGYSDVFTRPSYQNGVASVVGGRRGVPDVSMSASCSGAVLIYETGTPTGTGWFSICGTSEASPLFSGIVALADQTNGRQPLGLINPALYVMSAEHAPGIVDVTQGNNTVHFTTPTSGKTVTIPGYSAGPGYNLATGVGTVNANLFVRELTQTVNRVGHGATYGYSDTFLPTP